MRYDEHPVEPLFLVFGIDNEGLVNHIRGPGNFHTNFSRTVNNHGDVSELGFFSDVSDRIFFQSSTIQ
jgi:hypothetical protein